MLTKKECDKAYTDLEISLTVLKRAIEGNEELINPVGIFNRALVTFARLIHEHFSNPPLKFEELKEGMFVWDNKHHTYIKIDRIWESYNKTIYFYAIGWECCENTEYESNRFYRKEVQDV